MTMGWIDKWLESRQAHQEALQRRKRKLAERASAYRTPHAMRKAIRELGLKPHKDRHALNAASVLDVSYEVFSSTEMRGRGKQREPIHVASIVEKRAGEFYDLAYENYSTWREKFEPVLSLLLLENGEFQLQRPNKRPVRIGTTRKIHTVDELSTALRKHIHR